MVAELQGRLAMGASSPRLWQPAPLSRFAEIAPSHAIMPASVGLAGRIWFTAMHAKSWYDHLPGFAAGTRHSQQVR